MESCFVWGFVCCFFLSFKFVNDFLHINISSSDVQAFPVLSLAPSVVETVAGNAFDGDQETK